jgi:hypothetical protein
LGKPWRGGGIDLHDDGSGRSHPPRAPRGLTDVELWFGDLPQRIQQHGDAPLLFGSALQLSRLDHDLDELRIHRYAPTVVKLSVVSPDKPVNLKAVAAYDRESEMRAAGMSFKTSEAAMGKAVDGNEIKYLILPDEPVQFIVTADGYQPFAETVNLQEGETKTLEVKLVAKP